MPDIFYLVSIWWKQMLAVTVLSLAVAGTILFLKPSKYLSVATALPGSSYSADKASVFNNNIQQLYPAMGTPDDLDMITGTAQLDTVYIFVSEQFNLADHYKTEEQGKAAILKSAYLLKANTRVIKSDYNELKVKVWDTDKNLAPQLANAIMDKLQAVHQDLQRSNNIATLANLKQEKKKLQAQIDTLNKIGGAGTVEQPANEKSVLSESIQQYDKLIGQYQLMADSKPPVLIIVERARVTDWPDKPRRIPILAATLVLSLLFSLLVILLIEKRKSAKQ